jgi:mycofactocin precursor
MKGGGKGRGGAIGSGLDRRGRTCVFPARSDHEAILSGRGTPAEGDRLAADVEEPMTLAEEAERQDTDDLVDEDIDDLLVEEVSIDGMCGVY